MGSFALMQTDVVLAVWAFVWPDDDRVLVIALRRGVVHLVVTSSARGVTCGKFKRQGESDARVVDLVHVEAQGSVTDLAKSGCAAAQLPRLVRQDVHSTDLAEVTRQLDRLGASFGAIFQHATTGATRYERHDGGRVTRRAKVVTEDVGETTDGSTAGD